VVLVVVLAVVTVAQTLVVLVQLVKVLLVETHYLVGLSEATVKVQVVVVQVL
jgi:hypothetical protein